MELFIKSLSNYVFKFIKYIKILHQNWIWMHCKLLNFKKIVNWNMLAMLKLLCINLFLGNQKKIWMRTKVLTNFLDKITMEYLLFLEIIGNYNNILFSYTLVV